MLITHNNDAGAFAVCINRPTKHTAKNLARELKLTVELPFQMYWGGPVQQGSIWMVHDNSWHNEHSLYVDSRWNITSHESMFYHMADGDAPRDFRLAFGFCSWMPGQLDMELSGQAPFSKRSSWLYAKDVDPKWVWECPVDELWDNACQLSAGQAINTWLQEFTIRRGKKNIESYIDARITLLKSDMEKASNPHDKNWYNRLIQELTWAKSPFHSCNGKGFEDN